MAIKIIIGGAPVAKGRGKVGKLPDGRVTVFTPAHTRKYESVIRNRATDAMEGKNPFNEPLIAIIKAYLPIPESWSQKKKMSAVHGFIKPVSRPDTDNYIKAALDGLNQIVFRDDSLVCRLIAEKNYSEKPRLEIEIITLAEVQKAKSEKLGAPIPPTNQNQQGVLL